MFDLPHTDASPNLMRYHFRLPPLHSEALVQGGNIMVRAGDPEETLPDQQIELRDAQTALAVLAYAAIDDLERAEDHAQTLADTLAHDPRVQTMLRNRIYRDRLNCEDMA